MSKQSRKTILQAVHELPVDDQVQLFYEIGESLPAHKEVLKTTLDVLNIQLRNLSVWSDELVTTLVSIFQEVPPNLREQNFRFLQLVSEIPWTNVFRSGAGTWHAITHMSVLAVNRAYFDFSVRVIERIVDNFYCEHCRNHAKEYFKTRDIRKPQTNNIYETRIILPDSKKQVVVSVLWLFLVEMHNFVNKRKHDAGYTNADQFSISDAYHLYYEHGIDAMRCKSSCGSVG